MINLTRIKSIVEDIVSDDEWVNDSHSSAEHKGIISGLNMLVKHLEETECSECEKEENQWLNSYVDFVESQFIKVHNSACEHADNLENDD